MRWQENIFESNKNEYGVHHTDISWVFIMYKFIKLCT